MIHVKYSMILQLLRLGIWPELGFVLLISSANLSSGAPCGPLSITAILVFIRAAVTVCERPSSLGLLTLPHQKQWSRPLEPRLRFHPMPSIQLYINMECYGIFIEGRASFV